MDINWTPEGMTKSEQNALFNFWTDRYAANAYKMSPEAHFGDGGTQLGFFNAVSVMKKIQEQFPGDLYRQRDQFGLAWEQRKDDFKKAFELNREGPDRERMLKLQQTEQAGKNFVISTRTPQQYEEHLADYKERMGELISLDAKHNHPITNPDRDLKKNPPTIEERLNWVTRNDRHLSKRYLPTQQTEVQQLENLRPDGVYLNGLNFNKEPKIEHKGNFVPEGLQRKVNDRIQSEQQMKTPAPAVPSPKAPEVRSSDSLEVPASQSKVEAKQPEHKVGDGKDYFIQPGVALNLEQLGQKLQKDETTQEREGRGQMQSNMKTFQEREKAGKAEFSPQAEHDAWAKKVEMADRSNTLKQEQAISPKMKTHEELKASPMAAEKAKLHEHFKVEPMKNDHSVQFDQKVGQPVLPSQTRPPMMSASKSHEGAQDPSSQVKPLGEVGNKLASRPPMMNSAKEQEALQGKSLDQVGNKLASRPPMMNSAKEQEALQGKSLDQVGNKLASRPPMMNSAKEQEAKPEGHSQVKMAPPLMRPLEQVAPQAQAPTQAPTMHPPVSVPAPTQRRHERGGYSR